MENADQTFEQEFGTAIKAMMDLHGFTATDMGNGIALWRKEMPHGGFVEISAYEGQLYADPDEAVWLITLTDCHGNDMPNDGLPADVTLAGTLAWIETADFGES